MVDVPADSFAGATHLSGRWCAQGNARRERSRTVQVWVVALASRSLGCAQRQRDRNYAGANRWPEFAVAQPRAAHQGVYLRVSRILVAVNGALALAGCTTALQGPSRQVPPPPISAPDLRLRLYAFAADSMMGR